MSKRLKLFKNKRELACEILCNLNSNVSLRKDFFELCSRIASKHSRQFLEDLVILQIRNHWRYNK